MSRTNYYYKDGKTIHEPGELCDHCGKLATICKAGTLLPMPETPIDNEFGLLDGDIHAHLECALEALKEYKEIVQEMEKAIREHK